MVSCRKKSPLLTATLMPAAIQILANSNGTVVKGNAGDYLMTGDGDPFFVSPSEYASDYEVVEDVPAPAPVPVTDPASPEPTVTQNPLPQ